MCKPTRMSSFISTATKLATISSAYRGVRAYMRKYRRHIEGLGMTGESFGKQYPFPIRIRRLRFR